jgi:hypothetical protein
VRVLLTGGVDKPTWCNGYHSSSIWANVFFRRRIGVNHPLHTIDDGFSVGDGSVDHLMGSPCVLRTPLLYSVVDCQSRGQIYGLKLDGYGFEFGTGMDLGINDDSETLLISYKMVEKGKLVDSSGLEMRVEWVLSLKIKELVECTT